MKYRRRLATTTPILLAAAAVWLIISGWVIARDPFVGFAVGIAPIAVYLLVRFAAVRVIAVAGGGMVVLGSSSDLGPNKIIFAAVVIVCAIVSAYRLIENPPRYAWVFRPLLWWGLAVIAAIGISYMASPAGGDIGTFGRQSIFYLLIVFGPIIGLDSARDLKQSTVYTLVGVIGVVAAAGFAADWLDRRGVTALPFGRFVLSSLVLPGFAFGLALVLFFHSRGFLRRALWLIPIVGIPIAMLVTGTRTNLIIFIAVVMVLGRFRNMRVPLGRMLLLVLVAGAVGLTLFPIIASVVVADPAFIQQRVQAALSAITGGGDQSLSFRQAQATIAAEMVAENPWFGYGLGYTIPFTVDSPLLTVLRLGWIGTALVLGFIGALSVAIYRARRAYGPNAATTAWWAFLAICAANVVFGTPLEDRGFGFAVMLACMAIGSGINASERNPDAEHPAIGSTR